MAKTCFMYEGSKLWNSISNGTKTIKNISEFKTLLKKWNRSPCICKTCIICAISFMYLKVLMVCCMFFSSHCYCHPVIYSLSLFIIILS